MADIAETTALLANEARMLDSSTIFYVIGYILVAYFAIYFVAVYAGPMITGQPPYYGPYGRQSAFAHPHPHFAVKSGLEGKNDPYLLSRVTNAIYNKPA